MRCATAWGHPSPPPDCPPGRARRQTVDGQLGREPRGRRCAGQVTGVQEQASVTGSRDDGAFSRGKATPRDPMRSGTMKSTNPFELPACDGFDYRAGAPATRPGRRPAAAVTAAGSRGRTLCESSDGCPTGAPHVAGADGPHALTALPRDVASRSPGKTASIRATTATDTATARTKCRAICKSCRTGRVIFCLPGPSRKRSCQHRGSVVGSSRLAVVGARGCSARLGSQDVHRRGSVALSSGALRVPLEYPQGPLMSPLSLDRAARTDNRVNPGSERPDVPDRRSGRPRTPPS